MHAVLEARRASPAILFLPHLQLWWETAPASLRATLTMLLSDLPPDLPLLLLATADVPLAELDSDALKLFGSGGESPRLECRVLKLFFLLQAQHCWPWRILSVSLPTMPEHVWGLQALRGVVMLCSNPEPSAAICG